MQIIILRFVADIMVAVIFFFPVSASASPMTNTLAGTISQARVAFQEGMEAVKRKDFAAAEESYNRCLSLDPKMTGALLGLAEIALKQNDMGKAENHLQMAINLSFESCEAQTALGRLYNLQNKITEAEAALKKALTLDHRSFSAHVDLGTLYVQQGKPEPAVELFRKAIAYNNLAMMAATSGNNLLEALGWAQTAVGLAPNIYQFQDTLGLVWRARGDLQTAILVLEHALTLDLARLDADLYYHLGLFYAEKGEKDRAVTAFSKVFELNSNFSQAEKIKTTIAKLK